jgi:hypothetical protein
VAIHDLDLLDTRVRPTKADSPLIVDANAVVAGPLALESFEAITRRNLQISSLDEISSGRSFRLATARDRPEAVRWNDGIR